MYDIYIYIWKIHENINFIQRCAFFAIELDVDRVRGQRGCASKSDELTDTVNMETASCSI